MDWCKCSYTSRRANSSNGAIIGVGCIVTKDVGHYSIIVENPAKEIKKRFSGSIIEKLEKTKWWTFEFDDLINKIEKYNSIVNK